jgi:Zn finger protein HypA/HybF involved in hydrogenase expression
VTELVPLHRTLESELFALLRGASLECLVCGEFVLHREGSLACGECGSTVSPRLEQGESGLQLGVQAG